MTVGERAKQTCDDFMRMGYLKAIEKALRDQIEDCAKIIDKHLTIRREMLKTSAANNDTYAFRGHTDAIFTAEMIAEEIRALAGPTTTTEERKEIER